MQEPCWQRNLRNVALSLIVLQSVILLFLVPLMTSQKMEKFGTKEVTSLTTWYYRKGVEEYRVTLPVALPSMPDEEMTFSTPLPLEFSSGTSICLRSSLSQVHVKVDGELIYNSGTAGSGGLIDSRWNLVQLPLSAAGKTLEISLVSNHAGRAGTLNEVVIGDESTILLNIVRRYGSGLIIGILIFLLGVLLLPLHFIMDKKSFPRQEAIYLSLFAMATSGWLLGESKMLQFFTGNGSFTTLLPFISLLLLPMPLVLYVEDFGELKNKWLLRTLFWAFVGNFIICNVLHFAGIADFYTTIPALHLLMIVAIISITAILVREAVARHNKRATYLLLAQSVLFISSLAGLVLFYRRDFSVTTIGLQIGLLCYIAVLSWYYYSKIKSLMQKNQETRYLRGLAYRDLLTGGKNRTAYYEDIPKYFNATSQKLSWLMLFDLNNLKDINDCYGHAAGDEALRTAFICIEECFAKYGSCYRIGGDEFAAFLDGPGEQEIEQAIQCFERTVREKDAQMPYEFQVALGFGWYDNTIYENFESLSQEVDRRMYANKVKQKIGRTAAPTPKEKPLAANHVASPKQG